MSTKGKLIVFTAPSGAGKTTIAKAVLNKRNDLQFSVSATTRQAREGEIEGQAYYFITRDEFNQKIEDDAFVEWEEFYEGSCYGTLKEEVERIRNLGKHVLFDVEVNGARNIKHLFGEQCLVVFVMPPSIESLRQRLSSRATETEESLKLRLQRAEMELSKAHEFDKIVQNDNLDMAISETLRILVDFLG